ncbi:MAG: PAS domain-containing protein [Spirochaetota bacterium]
MDQPAGNDYRALFESMQEGFALGEVIFDEAGEPFDYRLLDVNEAFGRITGLTRAVALGRTARELVPNIEQSWIETFGRVVTTGEPAEFVSEVSGLGKWLQVYAFCPQPGRLAHLIIDVTPQKHVESLLEEGERLFHVAVESFPGVFNIYDSERRLQYLNAEAVRMLGIEPDDVVGLKDEDVIPQEIHRQYLPALERAFATGEPQRLEVELPSDVGGIVHSVRYVPVLDDAGTVRHVLGVSEDVTEERRRERDLMESEARGRTRLNELETLMDTVPAFVFLSRDRECRSMTGNRATREILHVPPGASLSESADPDGRPDTFRVFRGGEEVPPEQLPVQRAAARGEEVRDFEFDLVYQDGSTRTLFGNAVPLRDEQGEAYGAVGAFVDISAKKEAEAALERSRGEAERHLAELEATYENAPVGLCVLDTDLRFVRINERLAEINGVPVSEHIGRTVGDVLPGIADGAEPGLRRIIETGEPILNFELSGTTPAQPGVERTWLESWIPLFDADGAVSGINLVAQEITDRKRAEEELHALNRTLERQVAARTAVAEAQAEQLRSLAVQLIETEEREHKRFAALLHEDLQQMLAGAQLHLQGLRRQRPDPPVQRVEALLGEAIEKTRRLSHELSPAVLNHSDLSTALEWLAGRVREEFGLRVHLSRDGDTEVGDQSVKVFLFRAAQELLFNVSKHADVDEAWVALSGADDEMRLVVGDEGAGFDPAVLEPSAARSGLGLLSLRERARSMAGSFELASRPGEGARFTLTVPRLVAESSRAPDPAASRQASDDPRAPDAGAEIALLVVDDHRVMREGLVTLLADQPGVRVCGEASSGREAVELAGRLRPDVVLMDVALPEMDGVEATRRIKALLPEVRIIGLSMYNDEETAGVMRAAGAEAFLNKAQPTSLLARAIYGVQTDSSAGG